MNLITKFDLNQIVYPISQRSVEEFTPCDFCGGVGEITVNATGKSGICSKCYGRRGHTHYVGKEWQVITEYASCVGKIDVEIYRDDDNYNESRISYMIEETGIGSGTIWHEDKLFGSIEEADEECEKRNKSIKL